MSIRDTAMHSINIVAKTTSFVTGATSGSNTLVTFAPGEITVINNKRPYGNQVAGIDNEVLISPGNKNESNDGIGVWRERQREMAAIFAGIVVFIFSLVGLILSLLGQCRGEDQLFQLSFALSMGLIGSLMFMKFACRCSMNNAWAYTAQFIGCSVISSFLVVSMLTGLLKPAEPEDGCYNFGCANIFAIIVCVAHGAVTIVYGTAILIITMAFGSIAVVSAFIN